MTMHPSVARARELHDLFERYIETRRRAFYPRVQRIAVEAGISERALLFLGYARQVKEGETVSVAALRRRVLYSAKETWRQRFQELVAAGLAEPVTEGWRFTDAGLGLMDRFWRENREHQRSLSLPAEPLHRVVTAIEDIVKRIDSRPGQRVHMLRKLAPDDRDRQPEAVRLEFAIFELAVSLDDGHIAAWEAAGYTGPLVDVLTRVWYGKTTWDELVKALDFTQEPEVLERHVRELVRRGDLVREGDRVELTTQGRATRERIEEETDRLGLAHWPKGEQLESLIGEMTALADALPPEDQLPKGPTH